MFSGAITAMVTPFRDGQVDEDRLRRNVAFQLENSIDGLVPCGTTGESPTLSHAEHDRVIEVTVEAAGDRVPVIAGTGSNATAEAMRLTHHARQAGAAASLQVNPYYNKPTQEGLYRHFMTIADACDLPLVLYNIPGRSGVALTAETIARLADHERIVAIKEATGSMDLASEIAARCGEKMVILSGDDSMTLPLMSVGGRGVISVLSNLIPDRVKAMCDAGLAGDLLEARRLHLELFPIMRGMLSLETNPIPIKAALQMTGSDTGEMRLPMCPISETNRRALETLLKENDLL